MLRSVCDPSLKEQHSVEKFVVETSGCIFPHTFDSTAITKLKFKNNYVAN